MIERLTVENPQAAAGTYRAPVRDRMWYKSTMENGIVSLFGTAIDRLGKYEDTGLTPEQIMRLKERCKA